MKWLQDLLDAAGKSQAELAKHLDIPAPRVSEMIRRPDKRRLQPNEIKPTAQFFGLKVDHILALLEKRRGALEAALHYLEHGREQDEVADGKKFAPASARRQQGAVIPITGEVAAGQWLDIDVEMDPRDFEQFPIAADPAYPYEAQYGLIVRGNSMNRVFSSGEVLHCLDVWKASVEPEKDDIVIVERIRAQASQREVTAKRITKRGKLIVLSPDSTEAKWKPIEFNPKDGHDGDEEVRVVAVVLATYRPIRRRK